MAKSTTTTTKPGATKTASITMRANGSMLMLLALRTELIRPLYRGRNHLRQDQERLGARTRQAGDPEGARPREGATANP
jgi:hypothetical protein